MIIKNAKALLLLTLISPLLSYAQGDFLATGVGRDFRDAERDMARSAYAKCEGGTPFLEEGPFVRDIGIFKEVSANYQCDSSDYQLIVVCESDESTIEVLTNFKPSSGFGSPKIIQGVFRVKSPLGVEVHEAFINNYNGNGLHYILYKLNDLERGYLGYRIGTFHVFKDEKYNRPMNLDGTGDFNCSTR